MLPRARAESIEILDDTLAVARSSKLNSQGKSPNAHSEGIYIPENQRIIKFDVKSIISKNIEI